MFNLLKRLSFDDTGATGIEYGLLASMIAMAALTAFETLGNEVEDLYNGTDGSVASALQGA